MLTKAVRGAIINFAKALLLQTSSYGGVAHLVERLLRMQEVRGSIPLISTNSVTIAYAVVTFSVYDNSHSYVGNFVVTVRYNVKKR